MSNTITKTLNLFLVLLLAVCGILTILFYAESIELDILMYWTYVLTFISIAAAIVFPIAFIITNPRNAVKSVLTVVLLIAIVGISYSLEPNAVLTWNGSDEFYRQAYPNITDPVVLENTIKSMTHKVGTGLLAMYILFFAAIATIIYTEVSKFFK